MKDEALERMMVDNMCAQVKEKTRAVAKIQRIAHSGIGSVT